MSLTVLPREAPNKPQCAKCQPFPHTWTTSRALAVTQKLKLPCVSLGHRLTPPLPPGLHPSELMLGRHHTEGNKPADPVPYVSAAVSQPEIENKAKASFLSLSLICESCQRGKKCSDKATPRRYLHALPLPSEFLANQGEVRYCKKTKHGPNCTGPSHTA